MKTSMQFILDWLITALAIVIVAYILPGVVVSGFFVALVTAVVLGIINMFIRPVLLVLTLPINIFSLGLFTLILNALLILLASAIVPGFEITNFWWALLFGILLWVVNLFLQPIRQPKMVR